MQSCPGEPELSAALREQLRAAAPVSSVRPRIEFDVVFRGGERPGADVTVSGAKSGTRHLEAKDSDCRELANALVVMLVMLMDVDPAHEDRRAQRTTAARARSTSHSLWLSAGGGAGYARPYRLGPLATGEIELRIERWNAALGGFWAPARAVASPPPGEVRVSLVAGSARGCRLVTGFDKGPQLSLCGALSAGALTGSGAGYSTNRASRRPWWAAGVATDLAGALSDAVALGLLAVVEVPLSRQNFSVDFERQNAEIAYVPGWVSFALTGRVSVRLW